MITSRLPWLLALRRHWIAQAELNVAARPDDARVAVGFTFRDDVEFAAFCEVMGLPAAWVAEGRALIDTLALVPRHWVKLSFIEQRMVGRSRYFSFPRGREAPLTGLRLLLRHFGLGPEGLAQVEPLARALKGDDDTTWFVSFKARESEGEVNVSCGLPLDALAEALARLVAEGLLDADVARDVQAQRRGRAADRAYVTLKPGCATVCAVDYRLSDDPHRYVKVRPSCAERLYGPLVEALSENEMETLCAPSLCEDEVRRWTARWGKHRAIDAADPAGPFVLEGGAGLDALAQGSAGALEDVALVEVLSRAADPARVLSRVRQALRSGGKVRVIDLFAVVDSSDRVARLELAELERALARRPLRRAALVEAMAHAGFSAVETRPVTGRVVLRGVAGPNDPSPPDSPFIAACFRRFTRLRLEAWEVSARAID